MKDRQFFYTTLLAGVLGLSTMGLFYNGAQALDLGDFTGVDRQALTVDAPRAGGAVLVKEDVVVPTGKKRVMVQQVPVIYAGGTVRNPAYLTTAGGAGTPGGYLSRDTSNGPGDPFARVQAKFQSPGSESPPIDGKPLTTTVTANGQRVNTMTDIEPAAGPNTRLIQSRIGTKQSVRAITGRGSGGFNN